MDKQNRIRDLQTDRDRWQERLKQLSHERAKLLQDQAKGIKHLGTDGVDTIPARVLRADEAVLRHQEGLQRAEDRLARALNGEDV